MLCCVPKSSGPWSPLYLASYLRRPSSSSSTRTPPPTRCGPPRSSWQGRSPRPRRWASCATSRPRRVTRDSATCRTTRLLALRSERNMLCAVCSMLSLFYFILSPRFPPFFRHDFRSMIWAGSYVLGKPLLTIPHISRHTRLSTWVLCVGSAGTCAAAARWVRTSLCGVRGPPCRGDIRSQKVECTAQKTKGRR